MTINAILAHDEYYGIGKEGKLPWKHSPADMKWFRDCTKGHVVIMGRKTWESIRSTNLPGRINIVVTGSSCIGSPDATYSGDINDLLKMTKAEYPDLKIWLIGGADIYKQALSFCDNIYVTKFQGDYQCDAFVPMDKHLVGYTKMASKTQDGLEFTIWSRV